MSTTVGAGSPSRPPKGRPRKTRTRSGWQVIPAPPFLAAQIISLTCRKRRKKCDGARPTCQQCEARQDACRWGLKVSFHPSRALELTAEDAVTLAAFDKQHRRNLKEAAAPYPSFQIIDNTEAIVRLFREGCAGNTTSEDSDSDDQLIDSPGGSPNNVVSYEDDRGVDGFEATAVLNDQTAHGTVPQILSNVPSTPGGPAGELEVSQFTDLGVASEFPTHSPTFFMESGIYIAPFSLGQAISRGVSPEPDPTVPVSQRVVVSLMSAYVWETAGWCETTDSQKHFSTASIHNMMDSKPFVAAAMSLASRQIDNVQGYSQKRTLELYQYTIRLLLRQDPAESDASILAACTLLCVYEMMASNVMEWRRHLKGCAGLLRMRKWNGDSEGIVRSCFWAFARIDVWAAFSLDQTTLIPTESWVRNDDVESVASAGDLDDYCNLTTLMFARIINLLNDKSHPSRQGVLFADRVLRSWAELQLWRRCRLQEACPMLDIEASRTNPFPTIIYTRSSSICGNTFYHAACILLLRTRLVTATSPLDPAEVLEPVWHAVELGGISKSNPSHANWVNHLQPLYIAGRVFANISSAPSAGNAQGHSHVQARDGLNIGRGAFTDTAVGSDWSPQSSILGRGRAEEDGDFAVEKLALLKHLALIERETGWKTSGRARDLRILWGLENEVAA